MRDFYLSKLANTHNVHHQRFLKASTGRLTGGKLRETPLSSLIRIGADIMNRNRENMYRYFENERHDPNDPDTRELFIIAILTEYLREHDQARRIPAVQIDTLRNYMIDRYDRELRDYPLRDEAERLQRRESVREAVRQRLLRSQRFRLTERERRPSWADSSDEEGMDIDEGEERKEEGGEGDEGAEGEGAEGEGGEGEGGEGELTGGALSQHSLLKGTMYCNCGCPESKMKKRMSSMTPGFMNPSL